jgi:uncharacterized protein YoxC
LPQNYTLSNGKKSTVPDPKRFLFNVDTLYFTVNVEDYNYTMNTGMRLLETLEQGHEYALRNEGLNDVVSLKLPRYEEKIEFKIMSFGKKVYRYQLRNQDFAIYFMSTHDENSNFPIFVEINQFKLWQLGVIDAYLESLEILALLGFNVISCKPSRIDLCCHTDQFDFRMSDFKKVKSPPNMPINSVIRPDYIEDTFQTVYWGNRNYYQLRIYDKSTELFKKNKFHFLQIYEKYGLDQSKVWNIEFELSRKFLKNVKVDGESNFFDDVDNLISEKGLSALWTELTSNKFSMLRNLDKKDSLLPFWRIILAGNKGENGKSVFHQTNDYMSRVKEIDDSIEGEIAQIFGRLTKFAVADEIPEGVDEFNYSVSKFYELAHEYMKEKNKDFSELVDSKRRLYVSKEINSLVKKNSPSLNEKD